MDLLTPHFLPHAFPMRHPIHPRVTSAAAITIPHPQPPTTSTTDANKLSLNGPAAFDSPTERLHSPTGDLPPPHLAAVSTATTACYPAAMRFL